MPVEQLIQTICDTKQYYTLAGGNLSQAHPKAYLLTLIRYETFWRGILICRLGQTLQMATLQL